MKLIEDTKPERLITITFTEAELREIQRYAECYTATTGIVATAAARLNNNLKNLSLGERRDFDKLFL
jgi:hypothetical protein